MTYISDLYKVFILHAYDVIDLTRNILFMVDFLEWICKINFDPHMDK